MYATSTSHMYTTLMSNFFQPDSCVSHVLNMSFTAISYVFHNGCTIFSYALQMYAKCISHLFHMNSMCIPHVSKCCFEETRKPPEVTKENRRASGRTTTLHTDAQTESEIGLPVGLIAQSPMSCYLRYLQVSESASNLIIRKNSDCSPNSVCT